MTDGYLFVSGVDLDVRTKVALDLGWEPVPELMAEVHEGDPLVRADWPCQWWGLEPSIAGDADWQTRYASVFRVKRVDASRREFCRPARAGLEGRPPRLAP